MRCVAEYASRLLDLATLNGRPPGRPMAMELGSLPSELLVEIIWQLTDDIGLTALVCCSRMLHTLQSHVNERLAALAALQGWRAGLRGEFGFGTSRSFPANKRPWDHSDAHEAAAPT